MGWTIRVRIPVRGEIFRTCPDRPWGPLSLLCNRYRAFPRVKSGWGVTLTPHTLLMPWSWKGRAILLLPLWAVRPVQSLGACTRVHFSFTFCPCWCVYVALFGSRLNREMRNWSCDFWANSYRGYISPSVTLSSTDNALPEDGVTAPKHVGANLMIILILFLRQSLVHSLVNNKLSLYPYIYAFQRSVGFLTLVLSVWLVTLRQLWIDWLLLRREVTGLVWKVITEERSDWFSVTGYYWGEKWLV